MTWAEFKERYEPNLGRRSVNYTLWIVLTTSQINRIANWYGIDMKNKKETVSGRTHDGRNVTLTFERNIGTVGLLELSNRKCHFVCVSGNGICEDGFGYALGNKLLSDRCHLALTLMDTDTGFGMRRGSLMLVPEGSMRDPPVSEESDVCWPLDHDFEIRKKLGRTYETARCRKCGFVYERRRARWRRWMSWTASRSRRAWDSASGS